MVRVAKRLLIGSAAPVGCALAVLSAAPASASDLKLFTAETLEATGDFRLVTVHGEKSWVDGGFGKLRSGSENFRLQGQLGNSSIVWKPQFSWSLSATIVGSLQGGQRTEAGLSEAFLTFRPMRGSKVAFSARAGLMWPPISVEHEGADWHVRDSITPSAINSWIGEEVRPVAAEATVATEFGAHKLRATAAIMAANDTSGTLLTFRGWALHDRTTLAFHRQPLPPLGDEFVGYQASFTHPLLDISEGFARRPGYYAKLAWQSPVPVRFELFRYDNRSNPEAVNADVEWGWRTQFNQLAVVAELGSGTEFKAQAMEGHTRMGMREPERRWIDNRFRSAFAMLTRPFGKVGLAVRGDMFDTRHSGSLWDFEYNEHGWSAMIAAKREWGRLTGLVELLHVFSDNPAREHVEEKFRQHQTQLQAALRIRW